MNTINAEWEALAKEIMPDGAPDIQRREMRRAFFYGAEMMRRKMTDLGDGSVSEDAAVAMIDGWAEEFQLFILQMAKGEA